MGAKADHQSASRDRSGTPEVEADDPTTPPPFRHRSPFLPCVCGRSWSTDVEKAVSYLDTNLVMREH